MSKPSTLSVVNKLIEENPQIVGFIRSGTPKGDDIDLWCITSRKLSCKKEENIMSILNKSSETVDLYFHTIKQWESGDLGDRKGVKAENLLSDGIDPHRKQFHFDDTSMLAAYNYASADQFGRSKSTLDPMKVAKKIEVTYEGVIDWINYYTLAFLKHYISNPNRKSQNYISRKYIERLSKLLLRVAFGYYAAKQISKKNRRFIKDLFSIQTHPDLKLYKIIKKSKNKYFDKEQLRLLETAMKIRTKDVIPKDIETYITDGINLIFCLSSFIGIEKRGQRIVDKFISLALTDWAEEGSKRIYRNREILIKEGSSRNSDIFFIPVFRENGKINGSLEILKSKKKISISEPGRLVGEIKALSNIKMRTATVRAKGIVEAHVIPYKNIQKILSKQKELIQFERHKLPKTPDTRRLDILLRYLVFGSYDFLKTFVYSQRLSEDIQETVDSIKKDNPLSELFIGEEVLKPISNLYKEKFSLANSRMISQKKFKKGKRIFSLGEKARKLYLISKGEIGITELGENCNHIVKISKGLFFGESSLPPFNPKRLATAIALRDSELYVIDPVQFIRFCLTGSSRHGYLSPIEILYALVAQNLGRLKYVEKVAI